MIEHDIHGAKGGQKKPHVPVETPNNLLSVSYAKVLMAVAEGELYGTPTERDIFLDGTPLANADGSRNFQGIKWEWRSGTQHQEHIKGLPETSTEILSNDGELKPDFPWTRQITTPNLDAVRVTFVWNAMMVQQSNGDVTGSSVNYTIEVSTDGGPFVEMGNYTATGKTNTQYERTHRVDLPPSNGAGWTLRCRRITPTGGSNVSNAMRVKSHTEVIDVRQTYPHTALLYIEFDSRTFGGGNIPRVSVRTHGRIIQIPSNYDPRARSYIGTWDGSFKWDWTDNPAWVLYDLITQNRFGLGHKVDANMVDKWALYEVAQYCDVLVPKGDGSGELEPRHTCNIFIQQQNEAWSVLRDIASIFNGMTYWNGNQFVASADKEEDISDIAVFSRSNVINGRFDYQAADDKSIFTSALISYDDPANHYNSAVEATWERSQITRWGGDRQTSISAIGCTSRGEAQRRGKYTLLTNMYNRTVSFRTGLQGLSKGVLPGNIIHVVDPLIGGKPFTGRLVISAGRVITLDRNTEAKPGDILYITKTNGTTEGRTVSQVGLDGKVITVSTPYSEQPAPNAIWYLESADLKSQLFRVTKVKSPATNIFEIEGVEYNESKYGAIDNGARLESRPVNKVPPRIQAPPSEVNIVARTYVEQTMAVTTMTISWPQTENAIAYDVEWRTDDGDWVHVGQVGATEVDIKGIYAGNYVARVRAINPIGIASVWKTSMLTTLAGKEGKPPALAAIIPTPLFFGIRWDWQFPPMTSDTLKTQWMISETTSFADARAMGDFAYPIDSHEMHGVAAGKVFYVWARMVDRTGNIGPWYPSENGPGVRSQSMLNDNGQYNDYLAGMISETMLDKQLYDRIELIDGTGPGSVNDRIDQAVKDLEDQIGAISGSAIYDPTKTYLKGSIVRFGDKLYQAQKDVPINTPPPDLIYWKDVGDILEEANGLVERVDIAEQDIKEIDGELTAIGSQIESMTAKWREDDGTSAQNGAINEWKNRAAIITERTVRANADEAFAQEISIMKAEVDANKASITTLTQTTASADEALATRLDTLEVKVGTDIAGAIQSEATIRATADGALGTRIDTLTVNMETADATLDGRITTEENARVAADGALASRIDTIQANMLTDVQVKALIQVETQARVDADGALATQISTVQASAGANAIAIQETKTAVATVDGKVNAAWTMKIEHQSNGQYVAAGIGLGIENGPAGLQSQFLVRADRFAVVDGTTTTTTAPFVVQNGQVFIKQALIGDGFITNAMIGQLIQSNNYVPGSTGWRLDKNGSMEINGAVAGTGRLTITNNLIQVFDNNNVLRVRMGMW